jgi:hypothetical protein
MIMARKSPHGWGEVFSLMIVSLGVKDPPPDP